MSKLKKPATKTTLDKIKKQAKILGPHIGSLQKRQNIVSQSFGYDNYHSFHNAYKMNCSSKNGMFLEGKGCFSGVIFYSILNNKESLSEDVAETGGLKHRPLKFAEEYKVTSRFQLHKDNKSESSIKAFHDKMVKHIEDYIAYIFRTEDEKSKTIYDDFLKVKPNYNLRSVDIAVGVDFPEKLSAEDELKFADDWFYNKGKGGRISLSNFPNDGLVAKEAALILLYVIRATAEKTFGEKCYVFPSSISQDLTF